MAQNVKSVCDVLIANVKSVCDVTNANVKSIVDVDNTAGGGLNSFTDDFNRADGALGANWDLEIGSITVVSNSASLRTASYGKQLAVYIGGTLNTNDHAWYGQLVYAETGGNKYGHAVLRYTDDASPYYVIELATAENTAAWLMYPNAASGTSTEIGAPTAVTGNIDPNDFFGITVEGTGASTVFRLWLNPGAPFNTATDTTSSWNGSGPLITWNDDPGANAVDSGVTGGLQGFVAVAGDLAYGTFQISDAA